MQNKNLLYLFVYCLAFLLFGCREKKVADRFTSLDASESGINFSNDIDEKKMPDGALNEFAYMGGGVGILDVNNDGLKDIFFTGNQVSSRLYLNKGNNQFEDITICAGVSTSDWITGVSIVDINGDGYDDIYLCTYGKTLGTHSHNLLFINQHNNTFKEEAEAYGLADTSFSTQAVFFDYDKDGDLDLYLSNYMLNASYSANYLFPKNEAVRSEASDKLYRNDGNKNSTGHPLFTDVSLQAGIRENGYGLGVSVSDFNMDGWPDVYVCNDFVSNDDFWLNNKNGTFTNVLDRSTKHQSYSSMGCDAADINNDGRVDFATLDMMPEDNYRKKMTFSFMNYERYRQERNLGYSPEFMRNMLQLNNGNYSAGDTSVPFFSEIGQLAGVSETDWSWSILFADFDNDGLKDSYITNGIGRDFINSDFISFSQTQGENVSEKDFRESLRKKLKALKSVSLRNYLYLNNGDYTFRSVTGDAATANQTLSNGAAYVDLDNDGDLDLVVNNINEKASVFINNTNEAGKPKASHSISFTLQGEGQNTRGFGAKVFVYSKGSIQLQEEYPVRGYLSSVDTKLVFGTGKSANIDSTVVVWPNDKMQVLVNLKADSTYLLSQSDAGRNWSSAKNKIISPLMYDVTDSVKALYRHEDFIFNDYEQQPLLPQKYSQTGPFISVGDINNDGRTDFYVGAGFNSIPKLFIQEKNGSFAGRNFNDRSPFEEDESSIFFDADGDGDLDLLITYGDMRFSDTSQFYQPRLYLNDGKGNFKFSAIAIPSNVRTIAGCVAVADYDGDGQPDIFIGGRVSKEYPLSPGSFLLHNKKGVFTDVTKQVCPALQKPGMITAAQWIKQDGSLYPYLAIAGEYMPIRIFKNNGKSLIENKETGIGNIFGFWRSLLAADVDGDGDTDLIAGNLGLNCVYHASAKYPMKLFASDIDNNGKIDPILFYYIKDKNGERKLYPAMNRDKFSQQVPSIKKKFLLNKDFAEAGVKEFFPDSKNATVYTCNETRSCWFENIGNGKYVMHALPMEAQFAPVNAIICADFDHDGINDLLLAGNEYQTEVMTGRYDASYGCFLKGTSGGRFQVISAEKSGFKIDGDVKDMKLIQTNTHQQLLLVGINNDSMRIFKLR